MIALYVFLGLLAFLSLIIIKKTVELKNGRQAAAADRAKMKIERLTSFGIVKNLSILPLIDYYAERPDLKTEPGVSYLLKADDTLILMDVGFNAKKEHPSPLLHNMQAMNVSPKDLDMIFISHAHLDHLGGMKNQKEKTFSLSQGPVALSGIPVYAPVPLSASSWNPGPKTHVITEPKVLKPGIASIGVIPRFLFLMGQTLENALAVNVEGKGIVLIIGCGHQTIERVIERTLALFDTPIYAIIGGLHFPVGGGRIMIGPVNIQRLVGSDNPPWKSIRETDVQSAIAAIKKVKPKIVALSPHDSSDWSLDQFRKAFGDAYVDIRVGKEIVI
ncbi:MAG: MBL fold metallo-hydrolase [Desulfobacteraceae bacterium]|nr:MAG: MBL fold metallo-hydrolase [Desulfobacteraceae bacterium]